MSYLRVDYADGSYKYFKNDTEERASKFSPWAKMYIRLRRMEELPQGKKVGKRYFHTEKKEKTIDK